jgi:CheY-like chemotaxis protein
MPTLLIVEDGREYLDFFRLFLEEEHTYLHAQSGAEAFAHLEEEAVDLVVLDMRFERSPPKDLLGDVDQVARDYFGGDPARAQRFVADNQGTLVLAELRAQGYRQPVLFVSDLPSRKRDNLRGLYGEIRAVPNFDAAAIRREIAAGLKERP